MNCNIKPVQPNKVTKNFWTNYWTKNPHFNRSRKSKKLNSVLFFSFLFLVHIQACRALLIIALILGLVGIILSTMGLKCIKIGSKTDESKGKTMVIGGIIFISAGMQNYSMCAYEFKQFLLFNCLHVFPFYLASI